jgi:hypothetical protein
MMSEGGIGFTSCCGNFPMQDSAGGAGGGFEGNELGGEGFEDAGAKREVMEFTFADNVDKAGGFELFDVVGQGGGGDWQSGADLGTAERAAGLRDALEEIEAARVSKGF